MPGKGLLGSNLAAARRPFEGKGDSASNNAFTGIITVTVIEVLSNGNLLVSGEKQIGINQGSSSCAFPRESSHRFLRQRGVSTQVADARLEYRGNGYIDEAQTMGWLARFSCRSGVLAADLKAKSAT